jgi:hypothetical protein
MFFTNFGRISNFLVKIQAKNIILLQSNITACLKIQNTSHRKISSYATKRTQLPNTD